jgi:hypothetical protein
VLAIYVLVISPPYKIPVESSLSLLKEVLFAKEFINLVHLEFIIDFI